MMFRAIKVLFLGYIILINATLASTEDDVRELISNSSDVDGIVFEVLEFEARTWDWASDMIEKSSLLLKEYDSEIDIVVVSHGMDQFQLTKKAKILQEQSISLLENMVKNNTLSVSVCGAHSNMYGISEAAYISRVDVVDSGPATINDYRNLGYKILLLTRD